MTMTKSPAGRPSSATPAFRKLTLARGDQDPFPLYAELRQHAPIVRSTLPRSRGVYVLSRYAECSAALRSRALAPLNIERISALVPDWEERPAVRYLYGSSLFGGAPKHAHIRRRMNGYFDLTRLHSLRGFMADMADQYIRDLSLRGTNGRTVDLVGTLTLPYPLRVISRVLGIDNDPVTARLGWSGRALAGFLEPMRVPPRRDRTDRAGRELVGFFTNALRRRAGRPTDDLISTLIAANNDGELDERELLGNLLVLFIAGFDSATSFLGSAIKVLLDHPQQAAMVRDDPTVASSAVEELLRYAPPVHATSQVATAPVCLGDVEIPEGSLIWVLLASANRDPALTHQPDSLDVTRTNSPNLGSAEGPHTCIGAPLARMEAEVLLPRLLRSFPRMSLAGSPRHRSPGTALRGIDHLPVVLSP